MTPPQPLRPYGAYQHARTGTKATSRWYARTP